MSTVPINRVLTANNAISNRPILLPLSRSLIEAIFRERKCVDIRPDVDPFNTIRSGDTLSFSSLQNRIECKVISTQKFRNLAELMQENKIDASEIIDSTEKFKNWVDFYNALQTFPEYAPISPDLRVVVLHIQAIAETLWTHSSINKNWSTFYPPNNHDDHEALAKSYAKSLLHPPSDQKSFNLNELREFLDEESEEHPITDLEEFTLSQNDSFHPKRKIFEGDSIHLSSHQSFYEESFKGSISSPLDEDAIHRLTKKEDTPFGFPSKRKK